MESINHQDRPHIKYYKPGDLARGYMKQEILSFLENLNENTTFNNINETLEAYNVIRYLKDDSESISEITGKKISQSGKGLLYRKIATYISSINSESIDVLQQTDYDYIDDLFSLIDHHKLDEKFPIEDIIELWKKFKARYEVLFSTTRLVKKYGNELRSLLLENLNSAPFLIDYHFGSTPMESVTLPQSLSNEDTLSHIKNYLEQEENNLSIRHLYKVIEARSRYGLLIDDRTKLLARKSLKRMQEQIFSNGETATHIKYGVAIKINADQSRKIEVFNDGTNMIYSYQPCYLDSLIRSGGILKFFWYDLRMQTRDGVSCMSATQPDSGLRKLFYSNSGNDVYEDNNFMFALMKMTALSHIAFFEKLLRRYLLRLEDIFASFFNHHIEDEYGIAGFSFNPSTDQASYLEKCKHIITELDSITKQYKLLTEDGAIDQELLSISSTPVKIAAIPSLFDHKYLEINKKSILPNILEVLFSDQSDVTYINEELSARNLRTLVTENDIRVGDFHSYQQPLIDELIKQNILTTHEGYIRVASNEQMYLLDQIYNVRALNYVAYDSALKETIMMMVNNGWLVWKNSLLTTDEGELFSYYMNKSIFSNGLDLRNRYAHGSFSRQEKNDDIMHKENYTIFLMLYIILIGKVFCELELFHAEKS